MKRQQDRDLSPKNKRSRGGYGDHDDRGRDIYGFDSDRRDGRGRDSKPRGQGRDTRDRDREFDSGYSRPQGQRRYSNREPMDRGSDRNDSYGSSSRDNNGRERSSRQALPQQQTTSTSATHDYRTLCISNLNPDVHDGLVREVLQEEFSKYGDFNVKVVHQGDFRIAYVNFRYPSDAHEAKEAFPSLTLFNMPVRIDPVYQTYTKRQKSRSPEPVRHRDVVYEPREVSPILERRSSSGMRPAAVLRDSPRERGYQETQSLDRSGGEQKEHKFPHHLDHIEPEYDDKATRTLFVGSLDHDVSEADLRHVFERYGFVEDVDIKRKNQGNPYAFVRFLNLDMAHRAKVDMSGHYIGNSQCKIGYGKVNATCCLWVGGLGPWIIPEELVRLFDRFGPIQRMEWPAGKKFAYILYDDTDAAKSASTEMRGYPLAGPDRRLRVDFADPVHMDFKVDDRSDYRMPIEPAEPARRKDTTQEQPRSYNNNNNSRYSGRNDWQTERTEYHRNDRRTQVNDRYKHDTAAEVTDRRPGRNSFDNDRDRGSRTRMQQDRTPPQRDRNLDRGGGGYSPPPRRRHMSPPPRNDRGYGGERDRSTSDMDRRERNSSRQDVSSLPMGDLEQVSTIPDLASCLPVVWSGALVLKNSAFTTKMHLLSGDVHLVDTLMRDPSTTESPMLRITQRLRLDQPKLQEVHRRVGQSGGHSVLLAMPGTAYEDPNSGVQHRPLKNLVSYLKQKEAAGVISLPPYPSQDRDNVGVLHAFPSCQFSQDFLSQRAPRLSWDSSKEDFLVIVVVRGSAISA